MLLSGHRTPPTPFSPLKRDVAPQPMLSLPLLQRVWPTLDGVAPWPTLSLPSLQHVRQTLNNIAPWPTRSPPSPQHVWPTLGNNVWRPTLSPPLPQLVWPTLGDNVPRPTLSPPTPQRIRLTLGGVAPWPTHPAGAARQPCRLWPLLARRQPAYAVPPLAAHGRSIPARVAGGQEQPHVAVTMRSGKQAGRGGVNGKATGR
jgi:hypothetical protein